MNWWNRLRSKAPESMIEDRLLRGDRIPLQLAPDLLVHVGLAGLTMQLAQPMSDEQGRQLLLAARYAVTCPPVPPGAPEPAEDSYSDGEARFVRVALSPRQNETVGDVLAAYFRLTED